MNLVRVWDCKTWLPSLLLIFVCAILYGRAVQYDFVDYDDDEFVVKNTLVNQGFTAKGLKWAVTTQHSGEVVEGVDNLWTPLTWIVLMVEVEIYGLKPGGFHLTGVLLHILATLLVFQVVRLLCIRFGASDSARWTAFLVALLFCVHPLRVESVLWVSERKGQLCALFLLVSFWSYLRSKGAGSSWWVHLSWVAYFLACLSKPTAVAFPLVLFLTDYLSHSQRGGVLSFSVKRGIKYLSGKGYWLIPGVAVSLVTLYLLAGGTKANEGGGSLSMPVARLIQYVVLSVAPVNLNIDYPIPWWAGDLRILGAAMVLGAMFISLSLPFLKRRPLMLLGLGWFLIWLLPVLGFVHVSHSFVNDRYTYLPHIGLALSFVAYAAGNRIGRIAVILVSVGVLAPMSYSRLSAWKDSRTLYTAGAENQPKSSLCLGNLGYLEKLAGETEKALSLYQQAVEAEPLDYVALFQLGNLYHEQKEFSEAMEYYQRVIDILPGHHQSHAQLALCYYSLKDFPLARKHIVIACELSPNPSYRVLRRHLEGM